MNKELSPLEALENVWVGYGGKINDYNIVKNALKEYESAKSHIKALNKERIENSIKLKALEIIKERKIDMYRLQDCFDFELSNKKHTIKTIHGNMILSEEINESDATEYYNQNYDITYRITTEEFELLKEVLK